ncbi:MAG: hypothetical protein WC899_00925 [bacterium]
MKRPCRLIVNRMPCVSLGADAIENTLLSGQWRDGSYSSRAT